MLVAKSWTLAASGTTVFLSPRRSRCHKEAENGLWSIRTYREFLWLQVISIQGGQTDQVDIG
jgi:hypothetical protein